MRGILHVWVSIVLAAVTVLATIRPPIRPESNLASTLFQNPSFMDQGLLLQRSHPTLYFIRHGEKPSGKEDDGGLSEQGLKRAKCLREVFGNGSDYDIGHVLVEKKKNGG
ncbi:MAG: hypothetical protein M1831_007563 [Alyxoria varia]|nr:MAG: hypothetical protein M1831_007563 [Alyxoria varia]